MDNIFWMFKILYFILTFVIFYISRAIARFKYLKKLPPIILTSAIIILL